ncbi:hypothetical protein [Parasphingorhabdus sp.]|uniref:hypothetical protein n=1 Tax=Parasphingorhabdus sp. TaxID=2709688 RepID=UPI003A9269B3|tara:strand:- start:323 stop:484 length:162 start_codon:yes stop_codon:yes gene_type:complete
MQKYEALILDGGADLGCWLFAPDIEGIETARRYQVATNDEAERFSFSYQMEVK